MQYCGAIILQLKINKLMKNKMDLQKVKKKKKNPTLRELTLKLVNTLHNLKTKLALKNIYTHCPTLYMKE